MEGHFTEHYKVALHSPSVAAGTGTTTGTPIIDTQGFDQVVFILLLGDNANTSVVTLQAQQGAAANMSDAAALAGTSAQDAFDASSGDDKIMILEINNLRERYVRAQVVKATANIEIDGMISILGKARSKPITADTVSLLDTTVLNNPAEA